MARPVHEFTLYDAIKRGKFGTAAAILQANESLVQRFSTDSETPIGLAAQYGQNDIIRLLMDMGCTTIDDGDMFGETPLHRAVKNGHFSTVKLLLKLGCASVNTFNRFGKTPLHRASQSGDARVVNLLVEHGAIVDLHSGDNITPLHSAILSRNLDVASALLNAGSKVVNMVYGENTTLLGFAVERGHVETCKFLRANGAIDPSFVSYNPRFQ